MFIHILVGFVSFALGGLYLGWDITIWHLLAGATIASLPDILSLHKLSIGKQAHKHRDGFHHSLFFAPLAFLVLASLFPHQLPVIALAAITLFTHPLLDLYGIGSGVQLFRPFSCKTYKLLHNGYWLYVYTSAQEREAEAKAKGAGDWKDYIDPAVNKYIPMEYASLVSSLMIFFQFLD